MDQMSSMAKLSPDSRVIYLDYDGVLHPSGVYCTAKRGIHLRGYPGHALFEWASVLIELLEPHQDVVIVLSTSWVKELQFGKATKRLPERLQERVVGATWHSEMMRHPDQWETLTRYGQILRSVSRQRLTRWLAIDDDVYGWPGTSNERIVVCNEHRGLSDTATQEDLAKKLAAI
jgi:hypothetical protein